MAGTLTHIKFAHDLLPRLKKLNLNQDFFILGNQGHDLMYFIRLWELPVYDRFASFTRKLQEVDIKEFKKYYQNIKTVEGKSFFLGYLSHEILDDTVHPYIDKYVEINNDDHAYFESRMDYLLNDMVKIKKQIPKRLKISKEFKEEITFIFSDYFHNSYYGKRIIKSINHVYPFLWHYRFDKLGLKKKLYYLINKDKYKFLSYHFTKEELNIDISDFLKLYNQALDKSEKFLKEVTKK